MLDKLEKIIEILEMLTEKLVSLLVILLHKIIPQKVRDKFKAYTEKVKSFLSNIFHTALNFTIQKIYIAKDFILRLINKIKSIVNYPYQEKVNAKFSLVKDFLKTTPLKTIFTLSAKYIEPKFKVFKEKISKYASSQMYIAGGALCMILGALVGIYMSANDIYQKEHPYRAPASTQEYDYRPEYMQYESRTLKVQNIKIPLLVERAGKVDSITVDFTVRTSTKFAKHYLENYEYKLKDYFFTSVEPVISDFALEEEGKQIIKDKIKEEINYFLELEKVEGEVIEVRIQFIIAS